MPIVAANGIEIAYDEFGDAKAPVILLIMGLGTQMIAWPVPFCEALAARGFRVVRFDNRDIGLSTKFDSVGPVDVVAGFTRALAKTFAGTPPGTTEENIQSRVRGTTLMAISNKFGAMVLTTGNKSEMSVGYATLYGDMNGGFNPIKDLYKTQVFRLCHLRNRWKPAGAKGPDGVVIPENIIVKPPTAELRENQKDEDSLPPYEVLDAVLEGLVENEERVSDIVARGYDDGEQ